MGGQRADVPEHLASIREPAFHIVPGCCMEDREDMWNNAAGPDKSFETYVTLTPPKHLK